MYFFYIKLVIILDFYKKIYSKYKAIIWIISEQNLGKISDINDLYFNYYINNFG